MFTVTSSGIRVEHYEKNVISDVFSDVINGLIVFLINYANDFRRPFSFAYVKLPQS